MKPKKIEYSPAFFKALKKFPKSQLKFLERQEAIFKQDIFDRRLKSHKLKGQLKDFYSFSFSYHWRIVFHLEEDETIVLDSIGTHKVYK